ncbi:MAG TPA: hypothetical protein DEQ02_01155, partial [Ruminococcaceae bacterium]|nr:hypothetical protein [Oscillospiraceae bacterium]
KPAYENQAKVVYADRNHEDQGGYTNYSNVDAFAAKAPKAAIITDQLPSGVTYLRHSDQGGSVSDYDAATNTVTWAWDQ